MYFGRNYLQILHLHYIQFRVLQNSQLAIAVPTDIARMRVRFEFTREIVLFITVIIIYWKAFYFLYTVFIFITVFTGLLKIIKTFSNNMSNEIIKPVLIIEITNQQYFVQILCAFWNAFLLDNLECWCLIILSGRVFEVLILLGLVGQLLIIIYALHGMIIVFHCSFVGFQILYLVFGFRSIVCKSWCCLQICSR